jgi:hypothetical protein
VWHGFWPKSRRGTTKSTSPLIVGWIWLPNPPRS